MKINKGWIISLILVVLMVNGCGDDTSNENVIEQTEMSAQDYRCPDHLLGDTTLNKTCECYNHNGYNYTLKFNCDMTQSCQPSFEDKKRLAMIDDSWYCICEEQHLKGYCEEVISNSSWKYEPKVGVKEFNITTEFIWKY